MRNSLPLSVDNKPPAGVNQVLSPTISSPSGEGAYNYLELQAKTPSWLGEGCDTHDATGTWLETTCDKPGVRWFVPGECEDGHRYGKEIFCGKEWCSICGEDGSKAHNRRFVRWLSKIQQFKSMGYFVFTIPETLRCKFTDKKSLTRLAGRVQELLKSHGYSRGLRRWHFFGDKSKKWHPHLNVLVDGTFIAPDKLAKIKADYARLLNTDIVDVHYRYHRTPGTMVHSLKYVTRATFRDWAWEPEIALEIRRFRNMVPWGGRDRWNDEPEWDLGDLDSEGEKKVEGMDIRAVDSLSRGICPVCGKPVKWGEALPFSLLDIIEDRIDFGVGYWRLPDVIPREKWIKENYKEN